MDHSRQTCVHIIEASAMVAVLLLGMWTRVYRKRDANGAEAPAQSNRYQCASPSQVLRAFCRQSCAHGQDSACAQHQKAPLDNCHPDRDKIVEFIDWQLADNSFAEAGARERQGPAFHSWIPFKARRFRGSLLPQLTDVRLLTGVWGPWGTFHRI
eukprot:TRINITY_DN459_c0_g2_i2.p1 TRINITY_DN459_c0_g2~~TRINITY_DN459_c0_g2_i2.p1  ORF type:complete len:155 (+),score=8.95 TRINITY_DN459_c0_g2_i2:1285-1749(+)